MNLARYMSTDLMIMRMPPPEEPPDNPDLNLEKFKQKQKEKTLADFVTLLENSGKVLHRRKLLNDFINRERKASTALTNGLAIPHVRSRYVRDTLIAFARSFEGIDFDSMDGLPTHLFFIIVSPHHVGDFHIKIYKQLAEMFEFTDVFDQLMQVEEPGEVLRVIRQFD
ncbi:MAG: PTS sugar transporter subunit IIA [candidate division KSB1 bacterium]|nr:PTS sugar transporter subunit IIA [candidate division KSB1 bacterium]MDQ7066195.1 PTS sugar transporter subunit IIA [candidate division KSB1 bacterium]